MRRRKAEAGRIVTGNAFNIPSLKGREWLELMGSCRGFAVGWPGAGVVVDLEVVHTTQETGEINQELRNGEWYKEKEEGESTKIKGTKLAAFKGSFLAVAVRHVMGF